MEDCHSNIHALMTDEKSAKVSNVDGKDINVPSTSDLISALVTCNNRKGQRCSQCPAIAKYGYPRTCKRTIDLKSADRLESLQSELLQKTQELESIMRRAESAERDRNVAVEVLTDYQLAP